MNKKFFTLITIIGALTLATATGFYLGHRQMSNHSDEPMATTADSVAKPLYWYDPMRPQQHFDAPGKSPFMDMQLVPKYGDADVSSEGGVSISSQMAQNLGIRLAVVARASLARQLNVTGNVSADETRIETVQARSAGWVEQLLVRAAQEPVKRGQLLAEIYSPDLLAAQDEFLLALRSGDAGLVDASRERLRLLGVSDGQIAQVQRSGKSSRRIALYAPISGVVQELGARLGMQLQPGMTLFSLVDLSKVWVLAEVPEANVDLAVSGRKVDVQSAALPGRVLKGVIDYVYPEVMPTTRTLKLRVVLDNPQQLLKPGMYASVQLNGATRSTLLVPSEALIRSGSRSVVIVAEAGSRYRPVAVTVGAEADGRSEILSGLDEGQQVVASGQFLIDSEANLNGALSRIQGEPETPMEPTP